MNDWRKWLFVVAGLYDAFFGVAFFLYWPRLYAAFGVTPPNHEGYVRFPALLLIIFAFLFFRIARDPDANRSLIGYGIALKASYSGLVLWYRFTTGVAQMWVTWAWIDLLFLALFVVAWRPPARRARAAAG